MANPNPSPETRFKPGQSGNPSGRSSEELKAINEAAKAAAILRAAALSSLQERVENGADILEFIDANTLKLFKDSEDRAHGAPRAYTETKHDVADPLTELINHVAAKGQRLGVK